MGRLGLTGHRHLVDLGVRQIASLIEATRFPIKGGPDPTEPAEYEGLTVTPMGIDPEHCPSYLVGAARAAWDQALEQVADGLGQARHVGGRQVVVVAEDHVVIDDHRTGHLVAQQLVDRQQFGAGVGGRAPLQLRIVGIDHPRRGRVAVGDLGIGQAVDRVVAAGRERMTAQQAAHPSGSDSPMTTGMPSNSG